jgi:hypothetical protein
MFSSSKSSAKAMLLPSLANLTAIAFPIPLDERVTMAVFHSGSFIFYNFSFSLSGKCKEYVKPRNNLFFIA